MTDAGLARRVRVGVLLGALCGLAWAAALRAYMVEITPISVVSWYGTLGAVLLPGVITGGLLGLAWARGGAGRVNGIGWFALAPLSFAVLPLLQPGAIEQLLSDALGFGAIAFALGAVAGGIAVSGWGPLWLRLVLGVLAAAFVVALVMASPAVRGDRLALIEPRGVWVALLVASLAVILMLATSIPFRYLRAAGDRAAGVPAPEEARNTPQGV